MKSFIFMLFLIGLLISASAYAGETPRILIFISSSMPRTSLVQWMREAREINPPAALVMRGFVNDSLEDTRLFVGGLIKASEERGGVSIDPVLFEKYHIHTVPAVVVSLNDKSFDVVYGNTTLNAALRAIAANGETGNTLKSILSEKGGENA